MCGTIDRLSGQRPLIRYRTNRNKHPAAAATELTRRFCPFPRVVKEPAYAVLDDRFRFSRKAVLYDGAELVQATLIHEAVRALWLLSVATDGK